MYDPYYGGGFWAAYIGIILVGLLFAVAAYVLGAIFLRKIFVKAGVPNPNVAWIPVYNTLIFAKLGDVNPLAFLAAIAASAVLSWVPVLGFVIGLAPLAAFVMAAYRVNQKLQKEPVAFTIFAALLSIVWLGVVAFSQGVWNTASKPVAGLAPVPPPPWAAQPLLMDSTTWGGVPFQGYAATPPAPPMTPPTAPPPAA